MSDLSAWTPFVAQSALLVAVMGLMWRSLTHSMHQLEVRLDQKIDLKTDLLDHRLGALESDMTIVKQHLIGSLEPPRRAQ